MNPGLVRAMAIVGFAGALVMGALAWYMYNLQSATARWPHVKGTVVLSELRKVREEMMNRRLRDAWIPYIEYAYEVAGQRYVSHRISLRMYRSFTDASSGPPDSIKAIVSRYPAGAPVDVYYDGAKPQSALLEIDRTGVLVVAAIMIAFLTIGLASLVIPPR